MTSCRKPFSTRRSRWTRLRSSERNTRRLPCWSALSSSRDSASFSFGEGMEPPIFMGHYKSIVVREYKYITPCDYKSIAPYKYKSIVSCKCKFILLYMSKALLFNKLHVLELCWNISSALCKRGRPGVQVRSAARRCVHLSASRAADPRGHPFGRPADSTSAPGLEFRIRRGD